MERLFRYGTALAFVGLLVLAQRQPSLQERSLFFGIVRKLKWNGLAWSGMVFLLLAFLFFYASFIRHHVFQSSFDLAIFAQALWNTWQGDFLYSSLKGGICLLGDHVSPLLALLAPVYAIWKDPAVLLLVQALAAASAVFPLFLIGKKVLGNEKRALFFVALFAVYLPLRNAVRFDFHPELLGDPLLLWAFYFLLREKLSLASLFLGGGLLTKETACAPVAFLGLYAWWFQKKRGFGIGWFLLALGVFGLEVFVVAPYFAGGEYFYLYANYLAWQAQGLGAFLGHLSQSSTFTYLKEIFLPLGFFSFLSPPALILTLPVLFQNLAARNPLTRSIFFHYTAFLTPFVFVSAIDGFRNFLNWVGGQRLWNPKGVKLFGLFWGLSWGLLLMGTPELRIISDYQKMNNPRLAHIRNYLKTIPSVASVRTHEFFAPHLAHRKELYILPSRRELRIDEKRSLKEGASEKLQSAEYLILDQSFTKRPIKPHLRRLEEKDYFLKHENEGFYVFEKRKTG